MNKNKKSTKKLSAQQGNCKTDNVHEAPVKKSVKVDLKNDSPQHSYDSRVSGHSTPIRKKDYVIDVEDSPELDYRCSPISLPCTQDGGNEIAWDWQTSVNKGSNDKSKPSNNHIETPKRTKQLQKKRNSNSPLLHKPLKRKQVKMENIESIGKLTAELKALSEKMKSIQQNCNNHIIENEDDTKCDFDSKLIIELDNDSSDDIMVEVVNRDKPKIDSIAVNSNNKKNSSFEDLFDDSINDSMVKCSQEIEEKLKLSKGKTNETEDLSSISEKKEISSTSEKESHYLTTSNMSSGCSKSSNSSKPSLTNASGHLKTYSNNSSKMNSSSNFSVSNSKHFNNNFINVSDGKQTSQEKSLSDFPDDSFDDCLATCMEDEKLLSKLSEYDFSPSNLSHNISNSKKTPKRSIFNTISNKKTPNNFPQKSVACNDRSRNCKNSKLITDDLVDEIECITDIETIRKSFPSKSALENRKFFKTKSLSDQCFYQNKNINICTKATTIVKSEKRFQSNSVNPSVSTTLPVVRGQNSYKNNNFPSTNDMENVHALNRLGEKDAGNCTVKYKSASNLSSIKEAKESQPVQCTPEEIERKRLEAKMKLEAKRKLQQMKLTIDNTPSEVPMKKSVKR